MTTIKLDLTNIERSIASMKELQTYWNNKKLTPPISKGGGKLVSELQDMTKAYSNLHTSFMTMLNNTIKFMDGVKDDFVKNDEALTKIM